LPGKTILFTAPGGIRAVESLQKLRTYSERQGRACRVVEIDDQLVPAYVREKNPAAATRALLEGPGGLTVLLFFPKEYLRELWKRVASASIDAIPDDTELVFLSLHSVFYHNKSREFFPPVDVEHLKIELERKGLPVSMVVTLIDDVFDVVRHLSQPDQLFQHSSRATGYQKTVESVLNLHLSLSWRSIETFEASELARRLGVPHIVLAVKHTLAVAFEAVVSQGKMVYISHPITQARQDEEFIGEIRQLTEGLAARRFLVPISPTSIDELLIKGSKDSMLEPCLTERWPFGAEREILFKTPYEAEANPLDPDGVICGDSTHAQSVHGLLLTLEDAMRAQIASRDRLLVEQASALIVWRPFLSGRMSGGVQDELSHRNRLIEHEVIPADGSPFYVYDPEMDHAKTRVMKLVELLGERGILGGLSLDSSALDQLWFALPRRLKIHVPRRSGRPDESGSPRNR
jgi:hypothetical protein